MPTAANDRSTPGPFSIRNLRFSEAAGVSGSFLISIIAERDSPVKPGLEGFPRNGFQAVLSQRLLRSIPPEREPGRRGRTGTSRSMLTSRPLVVNLPFERLLERAWYSLSVIGPVSGEGEMIILEVQTAKREEMIDITRLVENELSRLGKWDGLCTVYVPHTTAAVTINENTDPYVSDDIMYQLRKLVPLEGGYAHSEGNSDAHVKASLVGLSVTLLVEEGRLRLGRLQGIFFCEFDGPRRRKVWIKFK